MITCKDIILDGDPILRKKCEKLEFPLSDEIKDLAKEMRQYIINSVDEEMCEKYDLLPAVGLAAPQVNHLIRLCCVYIEDEEQPVDLIMVNPRIIAYSNEQIFLDAGEACLSIKDEHPGIVERYAYIKVKYYDLDGNECVIEARDFPAVAIQHELDHLDGILFYDRIDKNNPFGPDNNSFPL